MTVILLSQSNIYQIDSLRVQAKELKKQGDIQNYCLRLLDLAEQFQIIGYIDSTLVYSEIADRLATTNNLPQIKAFAQNSIGSYYNQIGDYPLASEYFNKSLSFHLKDRDSLSVARMYENLGKNYKDIGDYKQSIEYLLKAVGIRERNQIQPLRPALYVSLGTVFSRIGDWESMFENLKKAEEMINTGTIPLDFQHVTLYNELGNYYDSIGDQKLSEEYYNKVITTSRILGWKLGIATGLSNLAEIYSQNKQYDRALDIHFQSLQLDREMASQYGIIKDYCFIAEALQMQDKLDLALAYADSALTISQEKEMLEEIATSLSIRSNILLSMNKTEEAFEDFYLYVAYKDSLENLEYKKHLSEMAEKYQGEAKEFEISRQKAEKKILKQHFLILLYALITSVMIIVIIAIVLYHNTLRNINQKLVLRHKLIRIQMNPHFIYNTMGAIQHYIQSNKSLLAIEYLGDYAQLMRLILDSSDSEVITLEQELMIVTKHIKLESLRFPDKFSSEIIVAPELSIEDIYLPPMLIQPLIENSIKHGFSNINYQGHIKIEIKTHENNIYLIVSDNGIGVGDGDIYKKSHALSILRERLITLKKLKKIDTEMKIELNQPSGTRITLRINNYERLIPE
jgi:tetratricopeptide (TPR) repeat protein